MHDPTAPTQTAVNPRAAEKILEPGERVGRLEVLRKIGTGGMGQVYLAHDGDLNRSVALKLLRTSDDGRHKARLLREAQVLAKLVHPNAVTVHDVGSHRGDLYIAMEYVEGGTLKSWSSENPAGARRRTTRALKLLLGAARGLAAVHEGGLVHRDVKPSNILVTEDERAKIADFGIARVAEGSSLAADPDRFFETHGSVDGDLTGTDQLVGSPRYMAPEQFLSNDVTPLADQFAFCVTAWEVLHGAHPFADEISITGIRAAIRRGPAEPTGVRISPPLEAALRKGLRERERGRHRDMRVLIDVFERELGVSSRATSVRFIASVGVGALLAGWAVAWSVGQTSERCVSPMLAEVWNPDRRARLQTRFDAEFADFDPEIWSRVEERVERYLDTWQGAWEATCTPGTGEAVEAERANTRRCLESRLVQLDETLQMFEEETRPVMVSADSLLFALPPAECERGEPGVDEALARRLIRARGLRRKGEFDEALAELGEIQTLAEGVLRAQTDLEHAQNLRVFGRYERANEEFLEVYSFGVRRNIEWVRGRSESYRFATLPQYEDEGFHSVELSRDNATSDRLEQVLRTRNAFVRSRRRGDLEEARALAAELLAESEFAPVVHAEQKMKVLTLLVAERDDVAQGLRLARSATDALARGYGRTHYDTYRARTALASSLSVSGSHDEALVEIEDVLSSLVQRYGSEHPVLLSFRSNRASIYENVGRIEDSIAEHESIIQQYQMNNGGCPSRDSMFEYGRVLVRAERYQDFVDSADMFHRCVSDETSGLSGTVALETMHAYILARLGRVRESQELLTRLESKFLSDETLSTAIGLIARSYLGNTYEELGQIDDALRVFSSLSQEIEGRRGTGPDYQVEVLGNYCSASIAADLNEQAVELCGRALERLSGKSNQVKAQVLTNYGAALFNLGRYEEAEESYAQALGLVSESEEIFLRSVLHANLGEVQELLLQFEDSEANYQAAFDIRTTVGLPRKLLMFPGLGLARVLVHRGGFDQAATVLARLEDPEKENPEVLALQGEVALGTGRRRAGRRLLSRAAATFYAAGSTAELQALCSTYPKVEGCGLLEEAP